MKKWNAPSVEELNINETAYNWRGNSWDGGYIGDGDSRNSPYGNLWRPCRKSWK